MRALARLRSPQGTSRVVTAAPAGVLIVLLGWLILSGGMGGQVTLSKLGAISSLLVVILVTAAVGMVVAAHQPRNPIGWLLVGESAFILLSINASAYANLVYRLGHHDLSFAGPPMLVLGQLFNFLLTGFPLLILLFPDGRLPSTRWRWALGAYLAIAGAALLATAGGVVSLVISHRVDLQASGNLGNLGRGSLAWIIPVQVTFLISVAAFWLIAVGYQALSWRRSTGERRQQLKWLASGAAACGFFGIWAIASNSAIWEVLILGFTALPVSIGVAILKYRLYEIDRIISRTLAYAIVTGLLIGVYAGLVLLATRVFTVHGTVAVAAATLAAVALFTPMRRRVQQIVDRRFNRARYDADRTLAAFSGRLTEALDLDSVRDDLAATVRAALEPAQVSVWLAGDPRGA